MPVALNISLLIGQKYGKLTILKEENPNSCGKRSVECSCECSNKVVTTINGLRSGNTTSCGCTRKEKNKSRAIHGHLSKGKQSAEYNSWINMVSRCENKNRSDYSRYGECGIRVCERWRTSFANFLSDMGLKPSPLHSIDRINNQGNYEPENCRWATSEEQNCNKKTNRLLEIRGKSQTISRWAKELNIHPQTLYSRLNRGLTAEEVLNIEYEN